VKQLLPRVVSSVETSSLSCTNDSNTYSVGTRDIQTPTSPCQLCHCLPYSLYAPVGRSLTCHAVQCPVPNCQSSSIPAGQCCPTCACDNGVEITNCPSSDVRLSLPASRDEVLYQFNPTTRDCAEQGRRITTSKTPQGNIYAWNGDTGHQVTVTATLAGTSASITCSFKVIPVGKSSFLLLTFQQFNFWHFSMFSLLSPKHVQGLISYYIFHLEIMTHS